MLFPEPRTAILHGPFGPMFSRHFPNGLKSAARAHVGTDFRYHSLDLQQVQCAVNLSGRSAERPYDLVDAGDRGQQADDFSFNRILPVSRGDIFRDTVLIIFRAGGAGFPAVTGFCRRNRRAKFQEHIFRG